MSDGCRLAQRSGVSVGGAEGARMSNSPVGNGIGRRVRVGLELGDEVDGCDCGCGGTCEGGRGEDGRLVEGVAAEGKGIDCWPKYSSWRLS